ncbi:MAG: hypothetical protein ACHQUC_00860 [Chlamydiales bacterium]
MRFNTNNRLVLSASLIIFYLLPVLFFSVYSISQMSSNKSWSVLSGGLLLVASCSLLLIFLVHYWEKAAEDKFKKHLLERKEQPEKENKVTSLDPALLFDHPHDAIEEPENLSVKETMKAELCSVQANLLECQAKMIQLQEELASKEELYKISLEENKQLIYKAQEIQQDFSDYKLFSEEQLKQKSLQLINLQQTIEDQRTEVERRQEQISQLDSKVHDLSYEIKTLLYLHETEASHPTPSFLKVDDSTKSLLTKVVSGKVDSSQPVYTLQEEYEGEAVSVESQIHTPAEAVLLMRKCINTAQKLTGANYYSNEASRFREFSSSHYTIDQRRLFDSLRSETSGLILVYSQKEHKLLFANNQTKYLLGCGPEKFVSDFSSHFQELPDWKKALSLLSTGPESQTRLLAKTKHGQEIILNCHLGVIPTGLFRNYVICVLYPT